jgi:hypothetical protein
MTSQTKKFIELSDISGLRLECKQCGCSLLIEIEREEGTIENLLAKNNNVLASCPTCGAEWAEFQRGTVMYDSEIKDFFRQLRDLRKLTSKFGCALTLEIKQEEEA